MGGVTVHVEMSERVCPSRWITMASDDRERSVRSALTSGDSALGAELALKAYGEEAFGFLFAAIEEPVAAREAYVAVRRRLRSELPSFAWRSSLRAWIYGIAWREVAKARLVRGARSRLAPVTRGTTRAEAALPMGRSSLVAELRARLAPIDRELLILRLDRHLSWGELAAASLGEGAAPTEIFREARHLRERFEQLRAAAGEVVTAGRILPLR